MARVCSSCHIRAMLHFFLWKYSSQLSESPKSRMASKTARRSEITTQTPVATPWVWAHSAIQFILTNAYYNPFPNQRPVEQLIAISRPSPGRYSGDWYITQDTAFPALGCQKTNLITGAKSKPREDLGFEYSMAGRKIQYNRCGHTGGLLLQNF